MNLICKKIILTVPALFVLSLPGFSAESKGPLTAEQICKRLTISEDVIVLDPTGNKIKTVLHNDRSTGNEFSAFDKKSAKEVVCSSSGTSRYSADELSQQVVFSYSWAVLGDGTITSSFEQGTDTDRTSKGNSIKGSLGKQTADLKDFAPLVWVSPLHKSERVIIRLTPSLTPETQFQSQLQFPLILDDATVFDGKGRLWAGNLTAKGEFIGVMTVQGLFVLSYQEFPGAKKIGKVVGHNIRFKTEDGTSVVIKTSTPILPGNIGADLYVLEDSNIKATGIASQHIFTGGKAEETIQRIQEMRRKR